jgi:2-amino-4-hydroxy-6-hydroxymethyldihydropteridine diphosphokinase
MARVFIGLGSNLGDKVLNCKKALNAISDFANIVSVSSVYKTEPVGNEDQPDFINCAAEIETVLPPLELLERLHSVEDKLERLRGEKWGPRTIDIDIIFYDDLIIDTDELTIPHLSAHTRRFVMEPICEIDPWLVHPGFRVHVYELLNDLEDTKRVVKIGEPSTLFPQ